MSLSTGNMTTPTLADLGEITFVKRITVGNLSQGLPFGDESEQEKQMDLLNRCLSNFPKGRIIGREVATGIFKLSQLQEDNQFIVHRITYHVGFKRKPDWL